MVHLVEELLEAAAEAVDAWFAFDAHGNLNHARDRHGKLNRNVMPRWVGAGAKARAGAQHCSLLVQLGQLEDIRADGLKSASSMGKMV